MSIWTKEELKTQITAYKEALLICSQGKSYSIGSRTLTRSDLPEILNILKYLEEEQDKLEGVKTSFIAHARIHGPHRR